MTRALLIAAVLFSFTAATLSQTVSTEKEVAEFVNKLREAGRTNDVAFFETALAPDYTYATAQGTVENRAAVLDYFRKLKETPSYRTLSHEMNDQQIRVFGDIAIVTANFRLVTEFKSAHPNDPPHLDEGRYTGIFQKRDGRWTVLMDHDSERPHDRQTMEKQVAALSRAYTDMIRRNDAASIAGVLADDYIVTDEKGKRFTKTEDLATYQDRAKTLKIETVEYKDQKVRMVTGSVAIDHSTIRFTGTKNGKRFDITEQTTTTFHFRDGRWLIVADHFSFVTPADTN